MTFVGKILVIVIMAFALLFLGISTVVFTTATNWRAAATTAKEQANKLQQENTDANSRLEALKADLAKAQAAHATAKKALDDKVASLNADIERIRGEVTAARGEVVQAQQNARTALEEAEARRRETELLREQKLAIEKQANDYKLRQAELNDQIRLLTRERDVAKRNADDLRDRAARYSALLRRNNISDDISQIKGTESPPAVHGEVARVRQNRVELTIGSDDGLAVGQVLHIYRLRPRSEYLGQIRIISVDPDQSVGEVIGRTIQGKPIKEGDIVASTFRVGPGV